MAHGGTAGGGCCVLSFKLCFIVSHFEFNIPSNIAALDGHLAFLATICCFAKQ